jgi:hypothetical protein
MHYMETSWMNNGYAHGYNLNRARDNFSWRLGVNKKSRAMAALRACFLIRAQCCRDFIFSISQSREESGAS